MSPTNLSALPSNLPAPNQRVQIKRGVASTDITVNNAVPAGTKLQDGAGGLMQITYTPTYNCYWVVRSNMLWAGVDGGWQRCDHSIMISPADMDGTTNGLQRCMELYDQGTVNWRTHAVSACFRLAGGVAYTAYMAFAYSAGYNQKYHTNTPWTRIFGVVYGEGFV